MDSVLLSAVEFLQSRKGPKPEPAAVVAALLEAEKYSRSAATDRRYPDLVGTWRLGFITGTQKARQQTGVVLGAGRFLPRFVEVSLSYRMSQENGDRGTVRNAVRIGPLEFALTGPTQFFPKQSLLAFDFIYMTVSMAEVNLYEGYIRGGAEREAQFYDVPLKERAFFSYFLLEERCVAARGRGGGLALWTRVKR
ncbi:hypothetical protein [Synechococcus sp. PCC 7336]|uniref:hypothetical protein n=1 Tax=Synechococcus sp. PCC 7336 TaxID=195250 RepID=UPI000345B9F6|nr:hypothetical protein [Synechococcus sp. PCC 7336]